MPEMTRDFTATTFIVQGDRTLLIYHKKIQDWFPPGGHIDPHELPCDAAVREVREETGLEVVLLQERSRLGKVEVLARPECILLEDITPHHQHIDLIYFARVVGGVLDIAESEAEDYRWCTAWELETPEIAEDICRLGQQAIEKVGRLA
ncbi:MAG: NUDIX domain-containing protein [bacterium]|nr:NUDIX domain-containing protein [bacterium]